MPSTPKPRLDRVVGTTFTVLIALRLWLSNTNIVTLRKDQHELSSPLTSFTELREGIYLFNHNVDPYSGGSFRHSPLLLALFATILPTSERAAAIIWTVADGISAWALLQIWRSRQNLLSSSRDALVVAAYMLNPYIFLPSVALSTSTLENTLLLLSILFACKEKRAACLLTLSFLLHLSLSSIVVLLPLALLLTGNSTSRLASPRHTESNLRNLLPTFVEFGVYTLVLSFISTIVAGSWHWIPQTWGATLTVPDLTPNTGLWWYFFTEMFDHFRPFFLVVFNVHLLIYILPICIKFQYDPLFATFILVGIVGTFKAYPTLSDPGLFLSMTAIFPEIYPYLKHPIVTILLHLHAAILMPLFHWLWLSQGTGNSNFFYATTLVFACANGAALVDTIWAGLRIAIGMHVDGYAVVQE